MPKDIHGGDVWQAAELLGIPSEDIIDFSASINPLGLPPRAWKAIKKSLASIPPYPSPIDSRLPDIYAKRHSIKASNVIAGNGSTEFIYLIPRVFKPEKAVIVEPAFSEYRRALVSAGCRADSFILKEKDGFRLNAEDLIKRLNKKDADALYIANPSNPSGALTKQADMIKIARACMSLNILFVVDEAFADFAEEASLMPFISSLKTTVVLRSMTKFFAMAGLRAGAAAANGVLIKKLRDAMQPWSVNTLASIAAAEALKDDAYIRNTFRWFKEERKNMADGLGRIDGLKVYPCAANFFMVKLTGKKDVKRVGKELFKMRILIRNLSAFTGLGPRYMRVAIKTRKENAALINALSVILKTPA